MLFLNVQRGQGVSEIGGPRRFEIQAFARARMNKREAKGVQHLAGRLVMGEFR